jgi:hypothetical protein
LRATVLYIGHYISNGHFESDEFSSRLFGRTTLAWGVFPHIKSKPSAPIIYTASIIFHLATANFTNFVGKQQRGLSTRSAAPRIFLYLNCG